MSYDRWPQLLTFIKLRTAAASAKRLAYIISQEPIGRRLTPIFSAALGRPRLPLQRDILPHIRRSAADLRHGRRRRANA